MARRGTTASGNITFKCTTHGCLTLLVPVVALFPRAQTLIVVQVLAVAVAAIPLVSAGSGARARRASGELARHRVFVDPGGAGAKLRQLFRERLRSVARLWRSAGGAQARFLVGADLRAAADGAQGRQILFVLWFAAACALWWDRRIGLALCVLAIANGIGFWTFERALRRAAERSRLFACRSSISAARYRMVAVVAGTLRICAADGRTLASARSAAACRDRLHAAVELRTEPHRIALRRAASGGHGDRRGVRNRALSRLRRARSCRARSS